MTEERRMLWLRAGGINAKLVSAVAVNARKEAFSNRRPHGFLVEAVKKMSIEARFVERVRKERSVQDPFGGVTVQRTVSYETVQFTLRSQFPQLEIVDAPRSLRLFLARLCAVSEYDLSATDIDVNLLQWHEQLKVRLNEELNVAHARLGDVDLSGTVSASIAASGRTGVLEQLERLAGQRGTLLSLRIRSDVNELTIELFSSGRAKIIGRPSAVDETAAAVRSALRDVADGG